jgi:predicted Rossmann fold nucleotide-binding protein DprA/Smf involved in DNA uptake
MQRGWHPSVTPNREDGCASPANFMDSTMSQYSEGKQMARVLSAIEAGCKTTAEIAKVTGLSVSLCSHWVFELIEAGLVRRTGEKRRCKGRGGEYKLFEMAA